MKELVLGAGHKRGKKVMSKFGETDYANPTYLDINPDTNPDIVHDLNERPLPFEDNSFTEIHAYEVLEHIGKQGDYKGFFEEFGEYWRILEPGGILYASVPWWQSEWAWGDPSHVRVITPGTLVFLSKRQYEEQLGKTAMSDFRSLLVGDWQSLGIEVQGESMYFALEAIKDGIII
jgi:predicted SAM-dependent methyltransferase